MSTQTMTLWLQDAARWCALQQRVRELEAQLAAYERMRAVQDERIIELVRERDSRLPHRHIARQSRDESWGRD